MVADLVAARDEIEAEPEGLVVGAGLPKNDCLVWLVDGSGVAQGEEGRNRDEKAHGKQR